MEKALRRTILRRNQLLKQNRKADYKNLRREWREFNMAKKSRDAYVNGLIKSERRHRSEDWRLGPLAPNREAGEERGRYGSVSPMLSQPPKLPKRYVKGPKGTGEDAKGTEDKNVFADGEWSGNSLAGNIVAGDRVAVIRGRPGVKGMIGEVSRVDHETNTVAIQKVNTVDLRIPSYALSKKEKFFTGELPVPINDVRLVVKLQDDVTGEEKDYVVKHTYGAGPYLQREAGSSLPRHTRYVAGLDVEIPWPAEDLEKQFTRDGDTPRNEVEAVTYTPSFTMLPMHAGVIDELRGKFSRERTNHDDFEWIKRNIIKDARESWLKTRGELVAGRTSQSLTTPVSRTTPTPRQAAEMQETAKLVAQFQAINLGIPKPPDAECVMVATN